MAEFMKKRLNIHAQKLKGFNDHSTLKWKKP